MSNLAAAIVAAYFFAASIFLLSASAVEWALLFMGIALAFSLLWL